MSAARLLRFMLLVPTPVAALGALMSCATVGIERAGAASGPDVDVVRQAFDDWSAGVGGPFELLAEDAKWTITGSSPRSRTYSSKRQFIEEVIEPFQARLTRPLVPTVRRIYADGDTVIVHFDAAAVGRDGLPYRNSYAWFLRMNGGRIVEVTAFFDTRTFDEFWLRVQPQP